MAMFRISQAANLAGVSDDTIRRYVDTGHLDTKLDSSNRKVVEGVDLARFIREHAHPVTSPSSTNASSARNRFVGLVTAVTSDAVMSRVEIQCGAHRIVSLISSEAVQELGLAPGVLAVASVKSTNVVIETPKIP